MKTLMDFLAPFLAPFQIVNDETEATAGEFAVVVKEGQPVSLLGEKREPQQFWVAQVSDVNALTSSDLENLRGIADSAPALVLVNRLGQIQGVIHSDDVKDLGRTLIQREGTISKEFGEGSASPPGDVNVSVTIWVCSDLSHPRFIPHSAGVPAPDCPICHEPRKPKQKTLR
jgi:hypothetical protein